MIDSVISSSVVIEFVEDIGVSWTWNITTYENFLKCALGHIFAASVFLYS